MLSQIKTAVDQILRWLANDRMGSLESGARVIQEIEIGLKGNKVRIPLDVNSGSGGSE